MSRRIVTQADVITARSRKVTDLLANHFPAYRTKSNNLDIPGLAKAMGLSHETIYRVARGIEEVKLPIARKLVRFSHENQGANPFYLRDLMAFIVHDWDVYGDEPGVDELLA